MSDFEEDPRAQQRRARGARSNAGSYVRRFVGAGGIVWAVVWLVSSGRMPQWMDPGAPEEYDAWAAWVCEQNNAIDDEARALFPTRRIKYDPEFAAKTERVLQQKQALLAEMQQHAPVLWRWGLHRTLGLVLQDSIRHHEARWRQYQYTQQRVANIVGRGVYPEDFGAVWDTTAQSFPDPDNGLHAGKAYQRLYDQVHERLGMPPVAVWPQPTP